MRTSSSISARASACPGEIAAARPLQLVEHVPFDVSCECIAVNDGLDERGLHLEYHLHEFIDGLFADYIGDVDGPGLADAVRPILRLPVVRRDPVKIVEDHLCRCGDPEYRENFERASTKRKLVD